MRPYAVAALLALCLAPAPATAQANLVFAGTVVDSANNPLGNAEVALPGMGLARTTDNKGVFRISGVTAGVHRVTVRHIGYAQLDTVMTFTGTQTLEWRVTLGGVVTLDSVLVIAPLDPRLLEFAENRALGRGRFLTRADLAKVEGNTMASTMRSLGGVDVLSARGSAVFFASKRAPMSRCPPARSTPSYQEAKVAMEAVDDCLRREGLYYVPDQSERSMGIARACYPIVVIDGMQMNFGRPTRPFELGQYPAERLEALEWYESASQSPSKYNFTTAQCGVLVLHLRKK